MLFLTEAKPGKEKRKGLPGWEGLLLYRKEGYLTAFPWKSHALVSRIRPQGKRLATPRAR
jgi:hypothetical protein